MVYNIIIKLKFIQMIGPVPFEPEANLLKTYIEQNMKSYYGST
jgi:hypothetical protein